jgi:uncharacterized alpha-E superfamily protein
MLARAANSLFWLGRYMERMDAVARLIETAVRLSAMSETGDEWRSAIIAAGCEPSFAEHHAEAHYETCVPYLAHDRSNPSSILNCLDAARYNARSMRTALTREMWEIVNEAWQMGRKLTPDSFLLENLSDTLDQIKRHSTLFVGAYTSTMLRNDGYSFIRLGTFVERADNMARLLDVKYNVLLPSYASVGGFVDYQQWTTVLQAVSAVRAYHWVFRDQVKPWNVAELMLLRTEMPRSLRTCYDEINAELERLATLYGGDRGECHRLAGETRARLVYATVNSIFQRGLHEFLTEMVDDTTQLGQDIQAFYMR